MYWLLSVEKLSMQHFLSRQLLQIYGKEIAQYFPNRNKLVQNEQRVSWVSLVQCSIYISGKGFGIYRSRHVYIYPLPNCCLLQRFPNFFSWPIFVTNDTDGNLQIDNLSGLVYIHSAELSGPFTVCHDPCKHQGPPTLESIVNIFNSTSRKVISQSTYSTWSTLNTMYKSMLLTSTHGSITIYSDLKLQ